MFLVFDCSFCEIWKNVWQTCKLLVLCSRVLLMATELVADVEHKMADVGSLWCWREQYYNRNRHMSYSLMSKDIKVSFGRVVVGKIRTHTYMSYIYIYIIITNIFRNPVQKFILKNTETLYLCFLKCQRCRI